MPRSYTTKCNWQNILSESKMQIAGVSWVLKSVKAFCGMKGLKSNLQVWLYMRNPDLGQLESAKKKINNFFFSVKIKVPGKGGSGKH